MWTNVQWTGSLGPSATQRWFTFGWPVEFTHPDRVKTFSPITCRWFEAAASGAVVVGDGGVLLLQLDGDRHC